MKNIIKYLLITAAIMCTAQAAFADTNSNIMSRWAREQRFVDKEGANLTITVTYMSSEYIEALMQSEAKKNLWTQDELDNYKANYLKTLNLMNTIPINVKFVNNGPTMYMGPFDKMVKLKLDNKEYSPIEYDKRLNFKLQGTRDGLVFFPRYDEKTGKDLLKGVAMATVTFVPAISTILDGKTPKFVWDVKNDDPSRLYQGRTAAKLETDRLVQRLDKLHKDQAAEQSKLNAIDSEITTIQQRIDELAKQ